MDVKQFRKWSPVNLKCYVCSKQADKIIYLQLQTGMILILINIKNSYNGENTA